MTRLALVHSRDDRKFYNLFSLPLLTYLLTYLLTSRPLDDNEMTHKSCSFGMLFYILLNVHFNHTAMNGQFNMFAEFYPVSCG